MQVPSKSREKLGSWQKEVVFPLSGHSTRWSLRWSFISSFFYPKSYILNPISFLLLLFSIFYILSPSSAFAATLSLSPSSLSLAQGETASVNVVVGSADQSMNAASGIVAFPNDKLEIVSVSKSGSIATLWVQEPSFSNALGTVSFEGVVLTPGFTGASGKIITITFRGKSEGTARFSFSSGSVLANDGQGTEIMAG